ncbi:hypothetical protein WICMUC_002794 [Wickerhamomyces mucosus]|uniref:Nucleotide exchange factor SIL1 n=1 Tax=Wickerhamomyces mucosus TaxID=1378264 RepID=A0A9P8TD64_9ASCO|nr:hypothetical protein WICMUC_002794 [Wickerhamomyces mucosus]
MLLAQRSLLLLALGLPVLSLLIPQQDDNSICNQVECYSKDFIPTFEWQTIKEGQQIPQGLDIRLDWQTGLKEARLAEGKTHIQKDKSVQIMPEIKETDDKKIVHYNENDSDSEDPEILALKKALGSSNTVKDLPQVLEYLQTGLYEKDELILTLESLNEYSHSLKDGIKITEPKNFIPLFEVATDNAKYSYEIRELGLRAIAQSLRHNLKALENINAESTFKVLLQHLQSEDNSIIQKRLLGVISSVLQTNKNVDKFLKLDGENFLLRLYPHLSEDSKVRSLEIIEDINKLKLSKRSEENDSNLRLFDTIQNSLSNDELKDDHNLEKLFDKAVSLKESGQFKPNERFMIWLSNQLESRKLQKRDKVEDYNENLHRKLLEARHLVFGNPNALRKALDDEL